MGNRSSSRRSSRTRSSSSRRSSTRVSSKGELVMGTSNQDLMEKVSEDTICVAVGKEEEEGRSILLWACHNSGGRKICILHVHRPPKFIRHPLGPTRSPAKYVNERLVTEQKDRDRKNMYEILHKYDQICGKMGVQAEIRQTEMESIGEGIVALITQYGIKRLVMGAAAENRYSRKMIDLKSRKAKYVLERAPADCSIQFICKGCLIHTRKPHIHTENEESSLVMVRSQSVPSGNNWNEAQTRGSNLFGSQSVAQNHICQDRNIVSNIFNPTFQGGTKELISSSKSRLETDQHNSNSDHQELADVVLLRSPSGSSCSTCSHKRVIDLTLSPLILKPTTPTLEGFEFMSASSPSSLFAVDVASSIGAQSVVDKNSDNPHYEKLQQVMKEAEKLTFLQQKVAKELGEAMGKAHEELILQREIEEEKAKEREIRTMKNHIDQLMEKFKIFQEHETSLKNQIVELQAERDNAMKEAGDLRNKQGEYLRSNDMPQFSEFSSSDIKKATQNFHESLKIGEGGYGNIYKGYLRQIEVAIKKIHFQSLHSSCGQGPSEFQMEVRVLSQLRHPNLVRLVGSCPEEFALIYEYLPNGSLEDRLRCRDKTPPLLWQTRINIATELCSVLMYLHSSKPHTIVHGDLKPSNILLDANFVSKLSDFGICRVLCHDQCSDSNKTLCHITIPKGTIGYVDPEFFETKVLTVKADVYSFGIILLQLLINQSPFCIADKVKSTLDVGNLKALLDHSAGDWPIVIAQTLAELALRCCVKDRKSRPELGSDVWDVLESIKASSVASSLTQLGPKGQ